MRICLGQIIVLITLVVLATANGFTAGVWTVTSSAKLDPRIVHDLQDLSRQERANLRVLPPTSKPSVGKIAKGNLAIDLRQAASVDAYLASLRNSVDNSPKDLTRELAGEGYTLTIGSENFTPPYRITITAATPQGFHCALLRIPQIIHSHDPRSFDDLAPRPQFSMIQSAGRASEVSLTDFPSFPERGIVEGFYGAPWSHQDRLAMLKFEGRHAMNVYYYAPKDDPYHRAMWRKPYPPQRMKRLKELAQAARANFVDFCFAISPGLSMTYSSDTDFTDLTNKLEGVRKLGVSCFALFLDDVPQELQSPQDQARFKTLAEAHVYVINKLYEHLKSKSADNRLVVTPTTYTNEWGSRDYIRELGAGVNANVSIVWTGVRVVSPTITATQAKEWGELLHRKPLVWDNFPVNDGIRWRVNLGPIIGRDADLAGTVSGFFSNPMVQPHATMIPLQTVAEYLWNPATYDPDTAQRRAITDQYGSDAMKDLAPFLSTYSDYWWDDNIFKPLYVEERRTIDLPEIKRRIALLQATAGALRKKPRYRALMNEISPLLAKNIKRADEVIDSATYRAQPDGKLAWRDDYLVLYAPRVSAPISLDGDFTKWRSGPLYVLDQANQIIAGQKHWHDAAQFSARFALGWDDQYLYIGADVTATGLYQPFTGRAIKRGDFVSLLLETAFRKNFYSISAGNDEYLLLLSPGNFADVKPCNYSEEDYLTFRAAPHDYNQEIKTSWRRTATGYSGDIAIPVRWFDGGKFQPGYEIGLTLGAQKALPNNLTTVNPNAEIPHIYLRSKADPVFPVRVGNPSTYQRLVLTDSPKQ
jgi:hypothetical protein